MIYRSNLTAPALETMFAHTVSRVMPHSLGHDVLSDFSDRPADDPVFALYKNCGFWTHSEVAILYHIAKQVGGDWLDIGAHTGWTAAHQAEAGCNVTAVDNMLPVADFAERFKENTKRWPKIKTFAGRSDEFFEQAPATQKFQGIVIDGDHGHPNPLNDARNAAKHLAESGVILLHDFMGRPVQEAAEHLMDSGFQCKVYWTPHMVACCWRGKFAPPDYVRDPAINWEHVRQVMAGFPFERCR